MDEQVTSHQKILEECPDSLKLSPTNPILYPTHHENTSIKPQRAEVLHHNIMNVVLCPVNTKVTIQRLNKLS